MVSLYGIIIATGILVALLMGEKLAEAKSLDTNNYWGTALWVIIFGVIGARLYHVIDYWDTYSLNTDWIWQLQRGGLGIYGAIFGGALGAFVYLVIKRENVSAWLDIAAIVTPLAQSIGRWGNYVNQELYGKPTTLPWAIYIQKVGDYFHPLFLYESILNFALFLILLYAFKKGRLAFGNGLYFAAFLLGYSIIRYWLEFLRIEPWSFGFMTVAQAAALVIMGFSVSKLMKNKIKEQEKALAQSAIETKTDQS